MDGDEQVDMVSADHTAHRDVWHKNQGIDSGELWQPGAIFRKVRMPGDFAVKDLNKVGDGELGANQIFGPSKGFTLALEDVAVTGEYRVVAVLYFEGGGKVANKFWF